MGRGANSKAMRKIQKDFARGKVVVGRGHSSLESSSTLTRKGYRNTKKSNLKHRETMTNGMMVYGTPTVKGVEEIAKTSGASKTAELTNDTQNMMKELLK